MKFMVTLILLFVLKSNAGQDGGGNYAFYYGSEKIAKQLFEELGHFERSFSSLLANESLIVQFNKIQKKYYPNMTDKEAKKIYNQFDSTLTGFSIDRLAKLTTGSSNWFQLVNGKIVVTIGFLQHFDRINESINTCEHLSILTNLFTTAFSNTSLSDSMQKLFATEMARDRIFQRMGQYPNCTEPQLVPVSLPYKTCNQMTIEESTYARNNLSHGQQELINKLNKPWAQDLLNRAALLAFSPHKPEEISIQSLIKIIKNIEFKPCQRTEVTKENYWDFPVITSPYLLTMDYRLNEEGITILEPFFSLYREKDLSENNLDKIQVELLHEALHMFGIGISRDGISDHGSRRLARSFVLNGELQFLPCGARKTLTESLIDCEISLDTAKNYGIRIQAPNLDTGWKLLRVTGTHHTLSKRFKFSNLTEDVFGHTVKSYDITTVYINMNNKTVITVDAMLDILSTPNEPNGKVLRRGPSSTSAEHAKFDSYSKDLANCQRRGRKFGIENMVPPTGTTNSSQISEILDIHYNEIWALNTLKKWPKNTFEWEWRYEAPFRYQTWVPEISSSPFLYDMKDNSVHSMDYYTDNNSLGLGQKICIGTN